MPFSFIKNSLRYQREINEWQAEYDAQAPKAGDRAPDFELADISGKHTIKLSNFQANKPVVLIFGSFT